MEIEEKEITSSQVPDEKYEEASIFEGKEMEVMGTSEEIKSGQRTLTLIMSETIRIRNKFNIDIEREEEKEIFSKLNEKLKKIK